MPDLILESLLCRSVDGDFCEKTYVSIQRSFTVQTANQHRIDKWAKTEIYLTAADVLVKIALCHPQGKCSLPPTATSDSPPTSLLAAAILLHVRGVGVTRKRKRCDEPTIRLSLGRIRFRGTAGAISERKASRTYRTRIWVNHHGIPLDSLAHLFQLPTARKPCSARPCSDGTGHLN